MKTVLYLPMISDDPSSFYRMVGVLSHIKHSELTFRNIQHVGIYSWSTFMDCDILIVQRPSTPGHINLIKMVKDMGIRVIVDFDDDLFNVPVHTNALMSLSDQKKNIKEAIHSADEVWVTTPALVELYKPFNRNIHVIPNAHNDYLYPVSKKRAFNSNQKLAVYRGGASHYPDIYQNLNDMVFMIRDNKEWEFRFMAGGSYTELNNRTNGLTNHSYTDAMSLMQFFKVYHEFNAPVAFFPLVTNLFNKSKSNISLIEATYAGSAFMGNRELPEFDFDFVTDISQGMYEPFKELKNDSRRMRQMNDWAWEWIMDNRLLSNINQLRTERLL